MGLSGRTSPKVVVLMGGPSAEREVSLSSGRECAKALRGEAFDVVELDAGPDLYAQLQELKPDVVFNAARKAALERSLSIASAEASTPECV